MKNIHTGSAAALLLINSTVAFVFYISIQTGAPQPAGTLTSLIVVLLIALFCYINLILLSSGSKITKAIFFLLIFSPWAYCAHLLWAFFP